MTGPSHSRPQSEQIGVFILAGGASQRMGVDKARLEFQGQPLALSLAERLAPFVAGVWLVAKRAQEYADLGLPTVTDPTNERALVHGIRTALEAPGPEWRWILACDMPGITEEILAAQWRVAWQERAPGCCPKLAQAPALEPLPSLWHASLALQIRPEWGLIARDWLEHAGLAVWAVPNEGAASMRNINTPEDWALLEDDPPPMEAP